ncbi:MAG TPA: thioesterase family protein [Beutenbergiaceae bacterium]|nr:thioesterase family protein [Beutenbergiaceae bacterium]
MTYFERVSESTYRATRHVSGAWRTDEQHIAPMLGLLVHLVETDHHARRDDGLVIGRLSYDILGIIPVEPVDVDIEVLRPGRTIELVQATVAHGGRCAVVLRAWFMQQQDTSALAGTDLPAIPPHQDMIPWDPTQDWPGGFIESLEVRRQQSRPGRAASWVRPKYALLDSEPVSALARAVGVFDAANGMTPRESPGEVAFPNLDLTAHLFRRPDGEWVGFDTTVSFGPRGIGLTTTTLHDADGPFGTMDQILTVRPM